MTSLIAKKTIPILAAAVLEVGAALLLAPRAQALTYSAQQLNCMLCFRQYGAANPYDLEVDLGPVAGFYAVPIGNTINITNYSVAQLANAMGVGTYDNVEFSVCAGDYAADGLDSTNYARGTMWITFARSDLNTPSSPFARSSPQSLTSACGVINNLGGQASAYSGIINADPLVNTTTAVAILPSDSHSCEKYIGPGSNSKLNNKFTQQIGQYAPSPFDTAIRSDFYVDYPTGSPDPLNHNATTGNVSLLGYFTFNPDGTTTFTRQAATVAPPPQPTLAITQTNGVVAISFPSSSGATYTLLHTDATGLATLPRASWTAAPGPIVGDGTVKQFTDGAPSSATRFYSISAHN
jgi:hypothetical protein